MENAKTKIKLPKGETGWVSYHDADGKALFVMTSKVLRDYYYLYKINDDGSLDKIGRAITPTELEDRYSVDDVCRGETSRSKATKKKRAD